MSAAKEPLAAALSDDGMRFAAFITKLRTADAATRMEIVLKMESILMPSDDPAVHEFLAHSRRYFDLLN